MEGKRKKVRVNFFIENKMIIFVAQRRENKALTYHLMNGKADYKVYRISHIAVYDHLHERPEAYDLSGRPLVNRSLSKGLYISHNKKYILNP